MSAQGKIQYRQGIPFIEVAGSYYQMGVQYGTLLARELRDITDKLAQYLKMICRGLPLPLRWFFPLLLPIRLRLLARKLPERFRQELRGVVDAAGVSYTSLLFGAFGAELIGACSTVLVRSGQQFIMGRNLDYGPSFLGEYPCVVRYRPAGKQPFVSIGIVGFLGCLTAVNKRGLMVSVNKIITAPGTKTNRFQDMPVGYALRQIVEETASLGEAKEVLQKYRPHGGWIITVGSSTTKEGAAFELVASRLRRRSLDRRGHLYSTNYFITEELSRCYTTFLYAQSAMNLARMNQIKACLAANPEPDCSQMISLLGSLDFHGRAVIGPSTPVVNNYATLQSIVISGEDIFLAAAPACAGASRWLRFHCGSFGAQIQRQACRGIVPAAIAFSKWHEQVYLLRAKKDYRGIAACTPQKAGNLTKSGTLVEAWRKGRVEGKALLALLAEELEQWPDYALPHIWKGEVLLKQNRLDQAVDALNAGLDAPICYPAQHMFAYRYLAEAWLKKGEKKKAEEYRDMCRDMLCAHVTGKAEKQVLVRLKKLFRRHSS